MNRLTVGECIKRARKINGHMTQEDLAFKANVAHSALSNYETDKISPKVSTLEKIAEACNSDLIELLRGCPHG